MRSRARHFLHSHLGRGLLSLAFLCPLTALADSTCNARFMTELVGHLAKSACGLSDNIQCLEAAGAVETLRAGKLMQRKYTEKIRAMLPAAQQNLESTRHALETHSAEINAEVESRLLARSFELKRALTTVEAEQLTTTALTELKDLVLHERLQTEEALVSALTKLAAKTKVANFKAVKALLRSQAGRAYLPELAIGSAARIRFAKYLVRGSSLALNVALFMVEPWGAGDCSTIDLSYMAHDSSCKAVYELNQNVTTFIELPAEEQQRLLSGSPALCSYYQEFNRRLIEGNDETTRVKSANCGVNSGIDVTLVHKGKTFHHQVEIDPATQALKNISVKEVIAGPRAKYAASNDLTLHFIDGTRLTAATVLSIVGLERKVPVAEFPDLVRQGSKGVSSALENYYAAQSYIVDAIQCCRMSGNEQAKCLDETILTGAGPAAATSQAPAAPAHPAEQAQPARR